MSDNYFGHVLSGPVFCSLLGHAVKKCHRQHMLRAFGHCVAICCEILGVGDSSLKMVKFEPTTPNMSQHIATHRNTVAKRTQHVAPNNVAICCVGMLRSFGRGLTSSKIPIIIHTKKSFSHTTHLTPSPPPHSPSLFHAPSYRSD